MTVSGEFYHKKTMENSKLPSGLMVNQTHASSNENTQNNVQIYINNETNSETSKEFEKKDFLSSQPNPLRIQSLRTRESTHLHISPLLPPPSSSVLSNYEQPFWNDTPATFGNYSLPPLHSGTPLMSFSYPLPTYTRNSYLPPEYLELGNYSPPWMTQMIKDHNIQYAEQRISQLKQKINSEDKKPDKLITTEPNFVTPATLTYVSNNLSLYLNGHGPDDAFWKSKFRNQPPVGFPEVKHKFEKESSQHSSRQQ